MNDAPLGIAIFGGGDARPGTDTYGRALALGGRLAQSGVPVVTGGYAGVMEAASRGARESGGQAIGVTCRLFAARSPNEWLTFEIEEPDLWTRTDRLFRLSRGVVVLEGSAGTLGELGMAWALLRAGALACPVVLWDDTWSRLYGELVNAGRLDDSVRRWTRTTRTLDDTIAAAMDDGAGP